LNASVISKDHTIQAFVSFLLPNSKLNGDSAIEIVKT